MLGELYSYLAAAAAGASLLGASYAKPLLAISVGYGTAMTLQSGLAYLRRGRQLDWFAKAHLALVALFGLRTVGFLLWRERLPSFSARRAKHHGRMGAMKPAQRIAMLGFCSLLYLAMFQPALRSSQPGPKAAPGSPLALLSAAALLAAGACLTLEATADVQQQLYYERGGKSPCRAGVWRFAHHANYHGEIGFWVCGYLAGLRSYSGPADALASSVGAAGMAWILTTGARKRRERQAAAAAAAAGSAADAKAK